MSMALSQSEHGSHPPAPIERPRALFTRLLYFVTRRRYGKTPTAFRIVYARAPWIAFVSVVIATVLERFLRLDRDLRFLLQIWTAKQNNCTFCVDLGKA